MKKQANFGSIIESFKKQLKVASCEEQGRKEESVTLGKSDSEVVSELPTPAQTNQKELERGVESGESLPDAPNSIPEECLERKEVSPETKIASPIDDLVSRLKANLKVAAEQAFTTTEPKAEEPKKDPSEQKQEKVEVPKTEKAGDSGKEHEAKLEKDAEVVDNAVVSAAEPVADTTSATLPEGTPEAKETDGHVVTDKVVAAAEPVTETGKTAEVNVDELAQKTAEFLRYSELGYEMAKAMFDSLPEQKVASEQSIDEQAIEQAVAERVENLKQAGYNDDQILAQLELDGQADAARLAGPSIEDLVNQKVATLQGLGVSDDEIMNVLQKDAEADSQALAQQLHGVIGELEQAVQAGQLTEEQALQLLEQSGLDVKGLLAAVQQQGGAAPEATAAPEAAVEAAPEAPAAVVEEAAKEDEPVAEEASEKKEPAKEKAEDKKEHKSDEESEKKEAAPVDASAAGSPVAASGMDQLPPEVQQLVQEIDKLLQSGAISEEQAMAMLDALFQGQAGGGQPGAAPEGVAGPAPTPEPTATPQVAA